MCKSQAEAHKIANALVDEGVQVGQTVVMLMPRIKEAYVVRQGIVKSGGAFVPIDPKYPDERVSYIISDSNTKYVITTKTILEEKLIVSSFSYEIVLSFQFYSAKVEKNF